jgi:Fe-S-cluster containining protein
VAAVFGCRRCGACCRGAKAGIELSGAEAEAIAAVLGLEAPAFRARFCLERQGRLVLKRGADRLCSLFSAEGCLAWGAKPRTCSVWPFPERLLADADAAAAVRASCPGLDPEASDWQLARALSLVQGAYPRS